MIDIPRWGGRWLLPAHWRFASLLPLRARRHYLHSVGARRRGNFSQPTTFNEKVNWRILNDRRAVVVEACDKAGMKDAARRAVPSDSDLRIPRTLWMGSDLDLAPDVWSGGAWILKPNHGSGNVLLGPSSLHEVKARAAGWLSSKQAEQLGEWGYSQARALYLLEERIPSEGPSPTDYKFFVFGGRVRMIQVNTNRLEGRSYASFFDAGWQRLPVRWLKTPPRDEVRPAQLEHMVSVAERIASDWDFLRVDLYAEGDEVWFGEITPYPGGGVISWLPPDFDTELGSWWDLDRSVAGG